MCIRDRDKLVWSKLDYAEQAVNDFYRYIDYLGVYRDGQCLAGMTAVSYTHLLGLMAKKRSWERQK